MSAVFQQILILYIFLTLGWLFGRLKKGLSEQAPLLSFLTVNLFLPCKVFRSFSKNFTVDYIREYSSLLLAGVCFLILFVALAIPLANLISKKPYERRIYRYTLSISNYAYLGYVLAEELLGAAGLTNQILFCIPFALYTYSFGYILLTGKDGSIKRLLNPMTVAILLGCIWGLTSLPVPAVLDQVITVSSNCVGPLSMLLTGLTLASFSMKGLVCNKAVYSVCALRLVLLPALTYGICRILGLSTILPSAVLMACMPCGLNTIIFPRLIGEDCSIGARLAFVSHLFSCITLPFWLLVILQG